MASEKALEQRAIKPKMAEVGGVAENPHRRETRALAKKMGITRRRLLRRLTKEKKYSD